MKRLILAVVCIAYFFANQTVFAYSQEEEHLRNAALSYLADPDFSDWSFLEKLSGTKAKLEVIDYEDGNIYFSIAVKDFSKGVIKSLCVDSKKTEFAKTATKKFKLEIGEKDSLDLGTYRYRGIERYFFRTPISNFRIDLSKRMTYRFNGLFYDISIEELKNFIANRSVYGGYLSVLEKKMGNKVTTFSNHGALVAKKEASLKRLSNRITKRAVAITKEKKIQALLDFVTREIEYSQKEALANVETLKRANEILMTGTSDCSGKVILFASLLEQIGVDYRLLYVGNETVRHITVAVTGDFPSQNNLTFTIGGKRYYVAETTTKGFAIGRSFLKNSIRASDIKHIQKPGNNSSIYDVKNKKYLKFL